MMIEIVVPLTLAAGILGFLAGAAWQHRQILRMGTPETRAAVIIGLQALEPAQRTAAIELVQAAAEVERHK